jgi:choline kinase
MAVSTAVILAAGRGMRLGDDYRERPKGFIPCQGTTLVERSLGLLTSCGISKVFIVTGHCADFYDNLAARSAGLVTTLFNDRYATNGSLVSFMAALDAVDEPFIVLDSDIVYERRALPALLACAMENAALVSGTTDSGDEYYAWADEVAGQPLPTVRRLSKHLSDEPGRAPIGEHVGILKIGRDLAARVRAAAPAKLAEQPMAFYEDCLIEHLPASPMGVVHIDDLVWCEVDDQRMLERANRLIFPRLDPL